VSTKWHNDLLENCLVALSINLGQSTYQGGLLQLPDRASDRVFDEIANTVPGDALLFRLDGALQHRATAVTAGVKTAFAGWFFGGRPSLVSLRALVALS
jgi:hypothetical protein